VGSLLGCPELILWLKSGDSIPNYFSRIRGLSSSLQKEELITATQGHEYRILGCCVYNMINVIRGSFLSFENPKGAHSWDILGGLNLALEHKLKVIVNDKAYSGEYLPADQKYRFWVGR
jgi:fructose-1,6-bisphosphatase/inositol monophosphatase family enzyme